MISADMAMIRWSGWVVMTWRMASSRDSSIWSSTEIASLSDRMEGR
jgi:hypothetical protein